MTRRWDYPSCNNTCLSDVLEPDFSGLDSAPQSVNIRFPTPTLVIVSLMRKEHQAGYDGMVVCNRDKTLSVYWVGHCGYLSRLSRGIGTTSGVTRVSSCTYRCWLACFLWSRNLWYISFLDEGNNAVRLIILSCLT